MGAAGSVGGGCRGVVGVATPGAALQRVLDALGRAGKTVEQQRNGDYLAQCPAHDDRSPSLAVAQKSGKVVMFCHALCDLGDILNVLRIGYADLFDQPLPVKARRATKNVLREFPYSNAASELTGTQVRQRDQSNGKRQFFPMKPNPDGSWDLGASDEMKQTPFQLPDLIAAIARGDPIWVAEGERDVQTLQYRCHVTATSNWGGAGKWGEKHAYWLRGANVTICIDRDKPGKTGTVAGEAHGRAVLASLAGIAASVRVVQPPAPHKDITDLIRAGGSLDDIEVVPVEVLAPVATEKPPVLGTPETNGHHPEPLTTDPEPHRGQLRFAKRFAGEYSGQLIYAHGIGWHHYRYRWIPCTDGFESRAVVKLLGDALRELPDLDKVARDELYKDVRRVESAAGVAGILTLASKERPTTVSADKLDGNPMLLNTPSGTVHLETGKTQKHVPFDYITKMTRGQFNPNSRADVFDKFLESIQPQAEMRDFLARSLGSSLLGLVRDHILFIWHGAGANGKSTLRDAVAHALGDYAVSVPSDLLLQSKYGHMAMAPDRMRLKGARLAFCSEISKGARLDEATMKDLTGNDNINAKMLYKDPIEFAPSHTLVMLTNHLPAVRGDDPATWRRIMAVPFEHVVPPGDRDLELPEKLRQVPEAVLAWLWLGWMDYRRQGLAPPDAVLGATKEYQYDSDILARFLDDEEAVTIRSGLRETSSDLYEGFTVWSRSQGERAGLNQKEFSAALEKRGFTKAKAHGVMTWHGLALTGPEESHPSDQGGGG